MANIPNCSGLADQIPQLRLALEQRQAAEVTAIQPEQIERIKAL
jgi:hypothetical protein